MRYCYVFIALLLIAGCAPFVPVADLNKVAPSEMAEMMKVRIFTVDNSASYPTVASILGEVSAYSCKHLLTDPPASKGDALRRLRLEAFRLQADAVIDVTFDTRGTDTWGTNCWETVHASGQAVKLQRVEDEGTRKQGSAKR